MIKYEGSVFNQRDTLATGNAYVNATVTVRKTFTGEKAALYSDNGVTPIDNPIKSDTRGNYKFWCEAGEYNIILNEGKAQEVVVSNVLIAGGGNITVPTVTALAQQSFSEGTYINVENMKDVAFLVASENATLETGDIRINNRLIAKIIIKQGYCIPEWFGAVGNGVTDDTAALTRAFNLGVRVDLQRRYAFSRLEINNSFSISGDGVLYYDGSATGFSSAIRINAPFRADRLRIESAGTGDSVFNYLECSSGMDINRLEMVAAAQRDTTGGASLFGGDINIGYVYAKNVARPIECRPESGVGARTNIHIDQITCINYIRGAFFAYCQDFSIGRTFMRQRWSGITTNQPGQNGLLFEGCNRFEVGRSYIADSAEHAVRIGGSANTTDFSFGKVKTQNSAGCSFKINPDTGWAATDGYIDGVTGINTGEGSGLGNREVVRLSKVVNLSVGNITGFDGCTRVLVMQDVDRIIIGEVFGEGVRDRLIECRTDFDNTQSNVENVYIGNAVGYMAGARAAFGLAYGGAGREIKNFVISDAFITGYTNFGTVMTGANVTGEVSITCRAPAADPRPAIENQPATNFITLNYHHGGTPYYGNLETFANDAAAGSLASGEVYKTAGGELRIKA